MIEVDPLARFTRLPPALTNHSFCFISRFLANKQSFWANIKTFRTITQIQCKRILYECCLEDAQGSQAEPGSEWLGRCRVFGWLSSMWKLLEDNNNLVLLKWLLTITHNWYGQLEYVTNAEAEWKVLPHMSCAWPGMQLDGNSDVDWMQTKSNGVE